MNKENFKTLTPYILVEIFDFLNIKDLGNCSSVCKHWNNVAKSVFQKVTAISINRGPAHEDLFNEDNCHNYAHIAPDKWRLNLLQAGDVVRLMKKTPNLLSLEIKSTYPADDKDYRKLKIFPAIINHTPKLEHLVVYCSLTVVKKEKALTTRVIKQLTCFGMGSKWRPDENKFALKHRDEELALYFSPAIEMKWFGNFAYTESGATILLMNCGIPGYMRTNNAFGKMERVVGLNDFTEEWAKQWLPSYAKDRISFKFDDNGTKDAIKAKIEKIQNVSRTDVRELYITIGSDGEHQAFNELISEAADLEKIVIKACDNEILTQSNYTATLEALAQKNSLRYLGLVVPINLDLDHLDPVIALKKLRVIRIYPHKNEISIDSNNNRKSRKKETNWTTFPKAVEDHFAKRMYHFKVDNNQTINMIK